MPESAQPLLHRVRAAGITASDTDELRMQKRLLALLSVLVSVAAAIWFLIYWASGARLPTLLPFALQAMIAANMCVFARWGNFPLYRTVLIGILLVFPFVAQWALGDFIAASGLILWGMLAPVTALLCLGIRESLSWFVLYIVLTVLTGLSDYFTADHIANAHPISPKVSVLFFTLNFVTLSALIYQCLRFAMLERSRALKLLEDAHARLADEQTRSERLLLNILPGPIAQRLKSSDDTIVDACPDATVMFADIVNFTEMAAELPPEAVFKVLNHVFCHFDELTEQHGMEKIKTIGDAYMVAGGLNDDSGAACATVAELALAMRAWLADDALAARHGLRLRIGVSTGPVVAGVVGRNKFIYDLWGDTVNLASRITSECPPGAIQCDSRTFARLKYRFVFEDPVTLRLKGKGMVSVWRLLGPGDEHPKPPRTYTAVDIDFNELD